MIDLAAQQQEFSRAYVHAVVAVAGYRAVPGPIPDDDSVDLSISARGPMGTTRSPRIDVQLKSERLARLTADPWRYKLELKNYDDLRHTDYQAPRILVVVAVPPDPAAWLHQTEERLALLHCGYWASLRGQPATTNTTNIRVSIPRSQVFSVDQLRAMMNRVGTGGHP